MFHRKWIAQAALLSVVAHDDVIYMHGSAARLWPLAAVYHSALLYEEKKNLEGLLCKRDAGTMYIYISSVSRLLRGSAMCFWYVANFSNVCKTFSSCGSDDGFKPQKFLFIKFSYNLC